MAGARSKRGARCTAARHSAASEHRLARRLLDRRDAATPLRLVPSGVTFSRAHLRCALERD
jgi:hypothetical protein